MLCENCGAQLPDGARFCLMCGAVVDSAKSTQEEPSLSAPQEAAIPDQETVSVPDDGNASDDSDATDVTGTFRVIPAAKKLEEPLNIGAVPFLPMAPAPRQTYVPRRIAHPVNQARPGSASSRPNVTAPKMQEFSWPENSSWSVPVQVDEEPLAEKPKRASLWTKFASRMTDDPQSVKTPTAPTVPTAPACEPVDEWPPIEPVEEESPYAKNNPVSYQPKHESWDSGENGRDASDAQATAQFSMPGTYAAKSPDQTDNLHAPGTAARSYVHSGHVTNRHVLIVAGILLAVIAVAGIGVATGTFKLFDDGGKDYTEYIRAEETSAEQDTTTAQEEPAEEEKDLAVAGVTTKASVENYTWEELSKIAKAIAAADSDNDGLKIATSYNLCDSKGKLDGTQFKEVKLTGGTTLYMRIAGFRQDNLADGGKAGITFLAINSAGTKRIMEYEGSNSDWENSALREWMNKDLLAKFPDEVTDVIQDAKKAANAAYSTGKSQGTTTDTLWTPSLSELYGAIPTGYSRKTTYTPEGDQYALFADMNVTFGAANEALEVTGTSDKYWWTRTPDSESAEHNICVSTAGSDYSTHVLTTDHSVLVGFCL